MGWSPEAKARAAERMRIRNADPSFKRRLAEAMKQRQRDPVFREKSRLAARRNAHKLNDTAAFRQASAARLREKNQCPDFQANRKGALQHCFSNPAWLSQRYAALRGVVVPVWAVKAELVTDYVSVAREAGEFAAAAHCRRLLSELRRAAPC